MTSFLNTSVLANYFMCSLQEAPVSEKGCIPAKNRDTILQPHLAGGQFLVRSFAAHWLKTSFLTAIVSSKAL